MTSKERLGGILAALESDPLLQFQVMSTVGQLIAESVLAEREACAKIAADADLQCHRHIKEPLQYATAGDWVVAARQAIAEQIRSRSTEDLHA